MMTKCYLYIYRMLSTRVQLLCTACLMKTNQTSHSSYLIYMTDSTNDERFEMIRHPANSMPCSVIQAVGTEVGPDSSMNSD